MFDLLEIRKEIDAVDANIQQLFEKRMELSREVAEYKINNDMKVFDKNRELEKLKVFRERANNEFNAHGIQELFQQIMGMSRKFQYQMLNEHGKMEKLPFRAVDALEKEGMKVVYQGVEGAYSHGATTAFFGQDIDSYHVEAWRDAMEDIKSGKADYAVLPIENSTAGSVYDNYDLLSQYDNQIVGEQIIKCEHVLVGVPGTKLADIKTVYSHPQALMQCRVFLDAHKDWKQMQYTNTAAATKKVMEEGDKTQAAIASKYAAQYYGMEILADKVYTSENNSTRFIIVAKDKIFVKDARKISICLELPHESGTLYNILSHFIYNNLNMTKIESRPIEQRNWEYRFFIDFDGNLEDSAVQNALGGIAQEASWMKIYGNY